MRKLLEDVMAQAEPPAVSARIREHRHRLGWSQEDAARKLNLSLGAYRAYETYREPKPARSREIARAFGLPDDYFLSSLPPPPDGWEARLARVEEQLAAIHAISLQLREEQLASRPPRRAKG